MNKTVLSLSALALLSSQKTLAIETAPWSCKTEVTRTNGEHIASYSEIVSPLTDSLVASHPVYEIGYDPATNTKTTLNLGTFVYQGRGMDLTATIVELSPGVSYESTPPTTATVIFGAKNSDQITLGDFKVSVSCVNTEFAARIAGTRLNEEVQTSNDAHTLGGVYVHGAKESDAAVQNKIHDAFITRGYSDTADSEYNEYDITVSSTSTVRKEKIKETCGPNRMLQCTREEQIYTCKVSTDSKTLSFTPFTGKQTFQAEGTTESIACLSATDQFIAQIKKFHPKKKSVKKIEKCRDDDES